MASTGLQAASWLAQSRLAVSYLKWGFDTVFRLIMNLIYLLLFYGSLHPPAVTGHLRILGCDGGEFQTLNDE